MSPAPALAGGPCVSSTETGSCARPAPPHMCMNGSAHEKRRALRLRRGLIRPGQARPSALAAGEARGARPGSRSLCATALLILIPYSTPKVYKRKPHIFLKRAGRGPQRLPPTRKCPARLCLCSPVRPAQAEPVSGPKGLAVDFAL